MTHRVLASPVCLSRGGGHGNTVGRLLLQKKKELKGGIDEPPGL